MDTQLRRPSHRLRPSQETRRRDKHEERRRKGQGLLLREAQPQLRARLPCAPGDSRMDRKNYVPPLAVGRPLGSASGEHRRNGTTQFHHQKARRDTEYQKTTGQ